VIRMLHLADVHLGASFSAFGELASDRAAAVRRAFRDLPSLAEREEVDLVLIAGDLFDRPDLPSQLVAEARDAIRRTVEGDRPVFIIPGNHDALSLAGSPYRQPLGGAHLFDEPRFGEPVTVETEGGAVHVYGIAHDLAGEPEPLATFERADRPGWHVVMLHGSVPDAPHWRPAPNTLRLPNDRLAGLAADYIALGDYHRPRLPEEFEGATAAYPGSFAALDLTESGPRGYLVVELGEEGVRVAHRSSGVQEVADLGEIDVSGCDNEVDIVEAIATLLEPGDRPVPSVRLVGEPDFPLDTAAVIEEARVRFGHARIVDDTRYFSSARLDEIAGQDTVAGHVARLGRERVRAAASDADRVAAERALRIVLAAMEVR
jgi:DNA repair protein SbcD/Mre11